MKLPPEHAFLAGGGEMGERTRTFDWSSTAVGSPDQWPQSLKTAVSVCLGSRHPIVVWWGNGTFTQFYNDAYISILGKEKHPAYLGRSGSECWSEIWPTMGPMWEEVFRTGQATWSEDFLYILNRSLPREEAYFTFSYSPIRDDKGEVGGIFCACNETTSRVLGERRLRTLGDLNRIEAEARTVQMACEIAVRTIGKNRNDIPFALIYLLDGDGRQAKFAAASPQEGRDAAPLTIDLEDSSDGGRSWPLRRVLEKGTAQIVSDVSARFGPLPGGPWAESPQSALIAPIPAPGQSNPTGFLVCGLSPRRNIDPDYTNFLNVVAGHIGSSIANARAYEEERKRAEALAEIDRVKTQFFSNVSHEFRTPLTLMLGPLPDALASSDLPSEQREQLDTAYRNSLRLLKLVNSLLDFSRIEAGRARATYEPADLASLTTDLSSNFRSACERAGLKLVIDCPPIGEPVYVDRDMWEKILLNLLSNAFKFTFDGQIAIRLRKIDGHAQMSVHDTGVGISPDQLPRIFDRFHRIEGQKSRTHEGSGIGLALVQELVKLHNGTIGIDSAPSRGSTFTVTIPLGLSHLSRDCIGPGKSVTATAIRADAYVEEALGWLPDSDNSSAAPRSMGAKQTAPHLEGARILLADDNADMRAYVRQLLGAFCEIETAKDGQEAIDAIRKRRPDLVLSDVMMPNLDGFGLLAAIRSDTELADLPVIFLSARADEDAEIEAFNAGVDDYLIKPFNARELLARIGANFRLAKLRQQAAADLRDTRRLHDTAQLCGRTDNHVAGRLDDVLQAAIEITNADKGNIQLLNAKSGTLELTVQRGFEKPFLDYFARVDRGEAAVCGQSMQSPTQTIVDDVTHSPIFADQESLRVLLDANVRAVQSTPLISSNGNLLGMISTHSCQPQRPSERQLRFIQVLARQAADYLERHHSRVALQYQIRQFQTLLNQAPIGVYLVDSEFRIREVNPAALAVFGDMPGGPVGRDFNEVIHILWEQKYADEIVEIFRTTLKTGEPYITPKRAEFRADRSRMEYYEWRVGRITLPDGTFGLVCYFRDISEQVQAETTRELLLSELNHRVKNTLASVQAIAQQTLRNTKDPTDFAARFSGRVQSLARVHSLLTDTTWQGTDLGELIRDQLLHGPVDEARVTAWGPTVRLEPQVAVHLALMLHELGTNCAKYGALSSSKGWVTISWTVIGDMLNLEWIERGGPTVSAPTRRGFGTTLIEQSAKGADGHAQMQFEPAGVTWKISLRLPHPEPFNGPMANFKPEMISVAPEQPGEEGPAKNRSKLAGLRFLVVEDEPIVALDLVDRLENAGASVAPAVGTEAEALQALESGEFDGALLDANLHGRPVVEIAAALTRRKIPFVLITGYGRQGLPASFQQAMVLSKPVSDDQLFDAIAAMSVKPHKVVRLKN